MVDKLFNFHDFDSIKKFLLKKYGYDIGKSKYNKNNTKDKIKLNIKQKRRIYNIYKKDFDLFNIDPELDECKYSLYENYYNVYSYSLNNLYNS
jgi:hypothetical protein